MATAEDDEIVLQEVIIDPSEIRKPLVERSNSLQIPGADGSRVKEPTLSRLLGLSPKIAPKFPREKLKSMFRKRKLSSAFPFYKLKGVSFTKDTKEVESINQSLLDISGSEVVDVEITLSTPELTEVEKETGVHPYYYTQQTITSAKQLTTGKAVTMRQPSLTRSESEEKRFKSHRMGRFLVRSNSLPNISHTDEYARYVPDPIIECSLKKISEVKEKMKKAKMKRKSPPPQLVEHEGDSSDKAEDIEVPSDAECSSRRNTLPQITLTRYGQRGSEQLDIVPSASEQSDDRDSGSGSRTPGRRDSAQQKTQSPKTSQQNISTTPSVKEKVETAPEPHSTSKKPRKPSPQRTKFTDSKDDPRKVLLKRKSPPPKRPGKLTFTRYTPTKKIAGISLKSDPASPTSDSAPSSPVSSIPSTSLRGRAQSIPTTSTPSEKAPSISPKRSPTKEVPTPSTEYRAAQADTTITITDSKEDLRQIPDQSRPPAPPQRHIPRAGGKGKK